MSPSALTRRIQAIEDELGHALFLRDQRSVALTRAGEHFREFAKHHLDKWAELQSELDDERRSPSGELKIACTVTACHSILPRLLAQSRNAYPDLLVRLTTQDAARSLEEVERGDVDLAVIPTDPALDLGLSTVRLGTTGLVFIGPIESWGNGCQDAPRLTTLEGQPLVVPSTGLERQRLTNYFEERRQTPLIVAEVRGNEGILAMVSLGSGYGLVPTLVLSSSPLRDKVRVLDELEPPPGYDVSLCAKPKNLRRRAVRAFWEIAQAAD